MKELVRQKGLISSSALAITIRREEMKEEAGDRQEPDDKGLYKSKDQKALKIKNLFLELI